MLIKFDFSSKTGILVVKFAFATANRDLAHAQTFCTRVTTLTKVTCGKYATRVPDEVAYGIYEWFSSQ